MRRPLLLSFMVLGLIITAVGSVGVFAPFTDRATTGTNDVSSGARPRAADLQIAWPAASFGTCSGETFVDDSTSPGIAANDVQPGFQQTVPFCLRNVGSSTLDLAVSIIDRVEVDFACTGDEAAIDTTCGNDAVGELGIVLTGYVALAPCGSGGVLNFIGFIGDSPTFPVGTIAPGATLCGSFETAYGLNRPESDMLLAQSDRVTWRLAFDGTTGS